MLVPHSVDGIDTSVLVAAKEIADRAIAAGYGPDRFARLAEVR